MMYLLPEIRRNLGSGPTYKVDLLHELQILFNLHIDCLERKLSL